MASFETHSRATRRWFQLNKGASCPPQEGDIQGGEAAMGRLGRIPRRAVLEERTWSSRKGYAAASRRPLGSLLHPFLERKGCARAA